MQVNPTNGYVKRWVYSGYAPYGAAIDKNGILWHPNGCCGSQNLGSINTNPNTVTYVNPDTNATAWTWAPYGVNKHSVSPGGSYGIAIDGLNRVYVGTYPQQSAAVYRYDPMRNTWATIPSTTDVNGTRLADAGVSRGITVDASGTVWAAQHGDGGGRLTGFNPNTLLPVLDVRLYPKASYPIGVGVGYAGKIWTNNQGTSNVSVVDPQTGAIGYYPVGGPPYTYSDFTGSILRTFTAPSGTYSEIVNACYGFQVNSWVNLVWQGTTPIGTTNGGRQASTTRIRFRLRAANQLTTKDAQGNPVDPAVATTWSYWFPDDIANPNKNAADLTRVYYYDLLPSNQWPSTGPCANVQSNTYNSSLNSYNVVGCADLSSTGFQLPTTYTWNSATPNQAIAYVQVQAQLVADGDNTVQPTLANFQLSRTCPQL